MNQIEYKMSPVLAETYLRIWKKTKKGTPQEFLCKVVNEEFGLKGECVRVLIS